MVAWFNSGLWQCTEPQKMLLCSLLMEAGQTGNPMICDPRCRWNSNYPSHTEPITATTHTCPTWRHQILRNLQDPQWQHKAHGSSDLEEGYLIYSGFSTNTHDATGSGHALLLLLPPSPHWPFPCHMATRCLSWMSYETFYINHTQQNVPTP